MSALISFVSKWERFFWDTNSTALKKWYVWLSGSNGGIIIARKNVTIIKNKNAILKTIKDLSNKSAFFNLLKFIEFLKFKIGNFLFFQKKSKIISSKMFKKITFFASIKLNKDKISIFKIISAKKAMKIIKPLSNIEAIINEEKRFKKIPKKNII